MGLQSTHFLHDHDQGAFVAGRDWLLNLFDPPNSAASDLHPWRGAFGLAQEPPIARR